MKHPNRRFTGCEKRPVAGMVPHMVHQVPPPALQIKGKMVNVFKMQLHNKTHTKLFSSLAPGKNERRIGSFSFPTSALSRTALHILLRAIFKLSSFRAGFQTIPLSEPWRLESTGQVQNQQM